MGIITINIKAQPPISIKDPKSVQKLSGAQLFIVAFPIGVAAVTTSATKAVVVAPSIGAATPPDKTVPAVAPAPAAIPTIPAFFKVVHPIKPIDERIRQLLGSQTIRPPKLLEPKLQWLLQ